MVICTNEIINQSGPRYTNLLGIDHLLHIRFLEVTDRILRPEVVTVGCGPWPPNPIRSQRPPLILVAKGHKILEVTDDYVI